MHVLYHMNAHIHPRPAAGTRSKGPSHGAKLWARATIGSTNLQAAGCYRYMLSSLLGETPYIFYIYTIRSPFFKGDFGSVACTELQPSIVSAMQAQYV
jgi:hypothetical protein